MTTPAPEPTPDETATAAQIPAADFDFDNWLSDAERAQRSVVVYKRADVLAELDELERKLVELDQIVDDEESLSTPVEAQRVPLESRYLELMQVFHDSGLRIVVQGLTQDELKTIQAEAKAEKLTEEQTGRRILEKAIISPKINYDQLGRLSQALGDAQIGRLVTAYQQATLGQPTVTAPFSRKSSGRDDGTE